ncbi:MAG: VWA domain-containing protein [Polyangiaceae bacterium]
MKKLGVRTVGALSMLVVSSTFNACSHDSSGGASGGGAGASTGGSGSGGHTGGVDAHEGGAGGDVPAGGGVGGTTGTAGAGGEVLSGGISGDSAGAGGDSSGGVASTSGGKAEGGVASTSGGSNAGGALSTSGGSNSGGSNSGGSVSTSGGSVSTSGGSVSTSGGSVSTSGGAGGAASCDATVSYNPQPSTVYLVVDRSGSMFDCVSTTGTPEPLCSNAADTTWNILKSAVLPIVQARQADVRFGFASFTGTYPGAGGTCPIIDRVAPALNNYGAISTLYNGLPLSSGSLAAGTKFESPTSVALDLVGAQLKTDTTPGEKFVLLLTDGEPDYCDDGDPLCPVDSVVASLQRLKKQGVTTLVFGIQWQYLGSPLATLQAFANAGAGESTTLSLTGATNIYDSCSLRPGWAADRVAAQKPAVRETTLGEYGTVAGPSKAFTPATDQTSLSNAIGGAVSGVKSCTVSLSSVYGKPTQLDSTKLNLVDIKLDGVSIALNAVSGWSLPSAGEIRMNGAACDSFRNTNKALTFNIGCAALTFN